MKKLLAYILLLVSICIGCFHGTVGSFMMAHADHEGMNMQVMSHDTMGHSEMGTENDCDDNMHECCISPFTDSTTSAYLTYTKTTSDEDVDDGDVDKEAIVNNNILQTSIEKLNSPPPDTGQNRQYIYSKSQYQHLVGVIKNNA